MGKFGIFVVVLLGLSFGGFVQSVEANLSKDEIAKWRAVGVYEFQIQKLKEGGVRIDEVKEWERVGISSASIVSHKKYGFTPNEYKEYKDAVSGMICEVTELKKNGVSVQEIVGYKNAGIKNCFSMVDFKKAGVSAKEYENWRDVGEPYMTKIVDFKNSGVSIEEYKIWSEIGAKDAKFITQLKQSNIPIDEFKGWIELKVTNLDSINEHKNAGFKTPKEYEPYAKYGLKYATNFKKWGVKLDTNIEELSKATDFIGQNPFFETKENYDGALKALKKCKGLEKGDIASDDIYATKKRCYFFRGSIYKRLDKSSAIVNGARLPVYLKFSGDWANNDIKKGIIIGEGDYSFKEEGVKMVIPKAKVLFFAN